MNIRVPKSIVQDLEFCNETFDISYPEIGQKALKCFDNANLELADIKPKEKERLSKEGFNLGDRPFCYTTEDFRNIVVWYVKRAMDKHNSNKQPKIKLDEYSFETDEQQLLIIMAEDRIKEKTIKIIKEVSKKDEMGYIREIDSLISEIKEI